MEGVFFLERAISFHTSLGLLDIYGRMLGEVVKSISSVFLGEPMSHFLMKMKLSAAWKSKEGDNMEHIKSGPHKSLSGDSGDLLCPITGDTSTLCHFQVYTHTHTQVN